MEVEIYWSSSSCFYSDTGKRMQQVVSEPSILGGERRLESRQSDAGITENRRELELQHSDSRWKLESQRSDARWEKNMQLLRNIISSKPSGEVAAADKESSRVEEEDQKVGIQWQKLEAQWRRMDAKFDVLKKAILDLSVSSQGRSMETIDASFGSRESQVRAGAVHWSCSTDLDPTDCNLSPMQKTEEHKVKGIDSESYFLSFSHDSMNSSVGNSIGVSELSTIGDDSLIEQHSNIVEEESIMSVKDAIAIYEEEFVNSRNSSMKFDVAAKASFDVKAEGLVDKEEKEVSKEVSMGEFLCLCKGIDGKYVQMDRTFDAFLFVDSIKVPMSSQMELVKVPMTNKMMVQNPSKCGWLEPNWFAMPKVKMKMEEVGLGDLIAASTQEFGEGIQLVDDAFVFLNGKVTRVVVAGSFFFHFGVDTGAGEILDHGKVNGIELEQYVVALLDNKTFSQAKEIKETKRLPIARRNASLRELAVTLNAVRNLTRLPVRYPKPLVKMKFMVIPVDSCRVFKGGGITRVTHMRVQYGEVIGGKLGKQFDLDKGRLQRITRGLRADDCDGIFKFADDAVIQLLCGLSEPMKEPNVSSSLPLQILIHGLSDGVLEVFFTSGDIYLGVDDLDKGVAEDKGVADWFAAGFKNEDGRDQLKDKQVLESLLKMEHFALIQSNISMPFIIATADGTKHSETTITRAKFEGVCSDLLGSGELVKKLIGSENVLYPESKELMHFVQHASKPFGNVEGNSRNIDNMLEAIEGIGGLEWFLASSYASSNNYRSLKRLSVRFPRPMVKMKLMKYIGRVYCYCGQESDMGESCIEAVTLMLADNSISYIDESDKMDTRDQWFVCWRLGFLPSLRTRKLKGDGLLRSQIDQVEHAPGVGSVEHTPGAGSRHVENKKGNMLSVWE